MGHLHPLRRIPEAELASLEAPLREVADALALLGRLHVARNRRPIAATLTLLFDTLRAHAGIAIWPTGEQALANCLRMVDVARRFERGGAASFRSFVRFLEREAERGEAQEAPVIEEGTEGVRIMTVHRAKGLEFPIVILCDPTCKATSGNASRHVDPERGLFAEALAGCTPVELQEAAPSELAREAEEAVRIAYVAATRARDLLVVPVVGDSQLQGWLDVLAPAVQPPVAERRRAELAPRCPRFGDDSALERPPRAGAETLDSVRPGLHRAEAGGEVVWWDPRALALDCEEKVGLRQQRMLEADASGAAADAGVRAHAEWQERRKNALERGSVPSTRVETVTRASRARAEAHAAAEGDAESRARAPAAPRAAAVRSDATEIDRGARPGGRRFGSLVHASLAAVPLDAGAEAIARVVTAQARLLGASAAERSAAETAVAGALAHPLLRRAASASELRREAPMLLRERDGSLIEGVVDLAFCESTPDGARWTVVDFKTDRELAAASRTYAEQVALYARAIAAATRAPCDAVVLAV
jgi:ATP-dependent exoDNAse (exonuclease V) beta subunit